MRSLLLLTVVAACSTGIETPGPKVGPTSRPPETPKTPPHSPEATTNAPDAAPVPDTGPPHEPSEMGCLRSAYGEHIQDVIEEKQTRYVVLKTGTRIPWDDGEKKDYETMLARPDMEDQLAMKYPKGRTGTPPGAGQDPGRIRVEAFFKAVYGETREAVQANLVTVPWLPGRAGRKLRFNRRAGAAKALTRVSEALDRGLPDDMTRFVTPPGGTYNWRTIAGTKRLSAHAFGIAVDINPKYGDYWRWRKGRSFTAYRNRIPWEIVEIFEANGFIWGGKWRHFDTLHFEYRPELLRGPCLQKGE